MNVTHITTKWGDITPEMLADLKTRYAVATKLGHAQFQLEDGRVMLTRFVKYLIEFCEANGLVAAGDLEHVTVEGAPIARGQEIITEFFSGITGIVAYAADHIAIHKGDEIIAIIGSPDLAAKLAAKIGN